LDRPHPKGNQALTQNGPIPEGKGRCKAVGAFRRSTEADIRKAAYSLENNPRQKF